MYAQVLGLLQHGADAGSLEPPLDDIQGRLLLGKEEDRPAAAHQVGNDVGDGLRLARPGRPLNDQVLAHHDVDQRAVLRGIGVMDQMGRDRLHLGIVDGIVLCRPQ